jgi:hypothetical protein
MGRTTSGRQTAASNPREAECASSTVRGNVSTAGHSSQPHILSAYVPAAAAAPREQMYHGSGPRPRAPTRLGVAVMLPLFETEEVPVGVCDAVSEAEAVTLDVCTREGAQNTADGERFNRRPRDVCSSEREPMPHPRLCG